MKWYLRDTREADWEAAEAATAALYRFAGISPPERFIRVRNPVTASQMGREIEPMGNMFFAPSWAPIAAVRERRGDCQPLVDLLLACGGVFPTKQVAILIDRPSVLSLDSNKFRQLTIRYPELALGMLKGLSLRIRQSNKNRQ